MDILKKKENIKRACFVLMISISILSIMNCDLMAEFFETDPEDLEYETHDLTLHVKAINHSEDTLGVRQAILPLHEYSYQRPFNPPSDDNIFLTDFPETLYIEIPPSDTGVYIYETEINYYIGYKEEHEGDITTYSGLDSRGVWHTEFRFADANVVLNSGDSLTTNDYLSIIIGDDVRANNRLDIEMIFDLNGLFYKDHRGFLRVNELKISSRQM